nr:Hok/Gef family protein [Klebsiella pneumoniae]
MFTCLTRNRLCEVRLRTGTGRSRQAAYESNGK